MKRASWVMALIATVIVGQVTLAATGTAAQSPPTRDRAAIEAAIMAQQKAWNEGNIDGVFEGYWHSEELTYSGSEGVARGWSAVRERFKKKYSNRQLMGKLLFSNLEVRLLGPDAALVLGRWNLTRESGNTGGVFSLVFQRFPDGWRIIHDHTSAVPTAAAAHRASAIPLWPIRSIIGS